MSLDVKMRAKLIDLLEILEEKGNATRIRHYKSNCRSKNFSEFNTERTGINQADISKLENETRNPSVALLKRLAEGMDMALKIEFIPKRRV